AANGIQVFSQRIDERDHASGRLGVGAAHDVRLAIRQRLDALEGHRVRVDARGDVADLAHVRQDLGSALTREDLLGDDASRYAGDRLARARTATTAVVAPAILGVEGVVGVAG